MGIPPPPSYFLSFFPSIAKINSGKHRPLFKSFATHNKQNVACVNKKTWTTAHRTAVFQKQQTVRQSCGLSLRLINGCNLCANITHRRLLRKKTTSANNEWFIQPTECLQWSTVKQELVHTAECLNALHSAYYSVLLCLLKCNKFLGCSWWTIIWISISKASNLGQKPNKMC